MHAVGRHAVMLRFMCNILSLYLLYIVNKTALNPKIVAKSLRKLSQTMLQALVWRPGNTREAEHIWTSTSAILSVCFIKLAHHRCSCVALISSHQSRLPPPKKNKARAKSKLNVTRIVLMLDSTSLGSTVIAIYLEY